jgi:methylmalonyl-CoA epimerase
VATSSLANEENPALLLRRLDHVAVAVRDTEQALRHFSEELGLPVVSREELETPPVTLVYLDAGNIYIQLVSPWAECELSRWLDDEGEGLHHLCFAVDDVSAALHALSGPSGPDAELGTGRGRVSGFVRNGRPFGVLVECTEFHPSDGQARGIDERVVG